MWFECDITISNFWQHNFFIDSRQIQEIYYDWGYFWNMDVFPQ